MSATTRPLLLWTEREAAYRWQWQQVGKRCPEAVVTTIDSAAPARDATADEHSPGLVPRRLTERLHESWMVSDKHGGNLEPLDMLFKDWAE